MFELSIELTGNVGSNSVKFNVKIVFFTQPNNVLYGSNIFNLCALNLWPNDKVFEEGVCHNLVVEFKDNGSFIISSIVGNDNL
jgi:hypothetical protein